MPMTVKDMNGGGCAQLPPFFLLNFADAIAWSESDEKAVHALSDRIVVA